jgi:putative oxidoreductase
MEMNFEPFLPFMLRVILGLLFFFQAYDILFRIGMKTTYNTVFQGTRPKSIPDGFTKISVALSTYIHLIGGLMLILGLYREIAMLVLGFNLIMTALGFGYLNGLWDMRHSDCLTQCESSNKNTVLAAISPTAL